jgi:phosphomannomutase
LDVKKIFKAYDVRGAYPDALNEDIARRIGRATADFLGCRNALVGHDMRGSGKPLADALIAGLRERDVAVTFIGQASSPLVYFAGRRHESSISVTASHNPPPDNGMKICAGGALPIGSANGLQDIGEKVAQGEPAPAEVRGSYDEASPREEFVDFSAKALHTTRPFKVVVDAGNGMGGPDYQVLSEHLETLQLVPLYWEPDDSFPHHEPNPLEFETLRDLQQKVVETGADLGIGLDGDADRCFFVDETGQIVSADLITALIAEDVLRENPGSTILYDLRSSKIVRERVAEQGGRPVECRVGHAFIKKQLREESGLFAGELSGHFYFEESSYAENTLIALFRILNILEARGEPLSQLIAPLRRYHSTGEINSRVEDAAAVIERLADRYGDGEVSRLDGLKVSYSDWWFNVRPSNTEPLLRLVLEAETAARMEEKRDEVLALIRS